MPLSHEDMKTNIDNRGRKDCLYTRDDLFTAKPKEKLRKLLRGSGGCRRQAAHANFCPNLHSATYVTLEFGSL